jgi:hypothetical protein
MDMNSTGIGTGVGTSNQVNAASNDTTKVNKKAADYGKTIGKPTLSEAGQKYYEELKKKFGNMDFILVSKDMKEQAKAQAGSYANPQKTVVLIDEEKVEKMATDENFRKQYEGIISNASNNMSAFKQRITSSGAKVKGFGIQVNDGGLTSYFAVLKKGSAAQKQRIAKKAEEKKTAKKEAEKKADKKEELERIHNHQTDDKGDINDINDIDNMDDSGDDSDTVTITANSVEELMKKIDDYYMSEKSNQVQTQEEMMVGQHIDFRG